MNDLIENCVVCGKELDFVESYEYGPAYIPCYKIYCCKISYRLPHKESFKSKTLRIEMPDGKHEEVMFCLDMDFNDIGISIFIFQLCNEDFYIVSYENVLTWRLGTGKELLRYKLNNLNLSTDVDYLFKKMISDCNKLNYLG